MMVLRSIILLLAITLASCGVFQNRHGPEKLQISNISPESAIIVLSAGSPEWCAKAAMYIVVKKAGSDYYDKDSTATWLNLSGYATKSDFADHHGYLHALQLQPGNYYLAPRWINDNYIIKAKRIPKADFKVRPGEVVYLGELYIADGCSLAGGVEFRDQEERDMNLLRERNPPLANAVTGKRILTLSGYALDVND